MRNLTHAFLIFSSLAIISSSQVAAGDLFGSANYNWSGVYAGGALGGASSSISGSFVSDPGVTFGEGDTSLVGGGYVGFQQKFGPVILGVEADYLGLTDRGTGVCNPIAACVPGSFVEGEINDIWSVGPRLGWDAGRWMPYVTGGYANAAIDFTGGSGGPTTSSHDRAGGWYVGGGVDLSVSGNWKLGVEYRHYEFDNVTSTPTVLGAPDPLDRWSLDPSTDSVTARLTYVFGRRDDPPPRLK